MSENYLGARNLIIGNLLLGELGLRGVLFYLWLPEVTQASIPLFPNPRQPYLGHTVGANQYFAH